MASHLNPEVSQLTDTPMNVKEPNDHLKATPFFKHAAEAWFAGVFDARGKIYLRPRGVQIRITSVDPKVAERCVAMYGGCVNRKKDDWADWMCPQQSAIKILEILLLWTHKESSKIVLAIMHAKTRKNAGKSQVNDGDGSQLRP